MKISGYEAILLTRQRAREGVRRARRESVEKPRSFLRSFFPRKKAWGRIFAWAHLQPIRPHS